MPKNIEWSELSEADFKSILLYLQINWDNKVIQDFIETTSTCINQISQNPKQFPIIQKQLSIRKCLLTKHNTLFYRELKDKVEILRIFDNRQDPRKLKYF